MYLQTAIKRLIFVTQQAANHLPLAKKHTIMIRHFFTYSFLLAIVGVAAAQTQVHTEEQIEIEVKSVLSASSCVGGSCDGEVQILLSGGLPPLSIVWDDGIGGDHRTDLCANHNYSFTVTDAMGTSVTEIVSVDYNDGCVWVGDADNNHNVSHFDILPIALTYGESGFPRASSYEGWLGQTVQDWQTVMPIEGLPNYKHIDTDGNGIINQNDALLITNNYGKHYNKPMQLGGVPSESSIPVGFAECLGRKGERVGTAINLGAPAYIAANVYGIAFTINYNPLYFQEGSESVDFSESWLTPDPISIQKSYPAEGRIEVAVARKDRINNTGFGSIGTLFLTIRDDVFRTEGEDLIPVTEITVSDIRLIDNANNVIGVQPMTGTITIEDNTVSSTPLISSDNNNSLEIYPNPSRQTAFIKIPAQAGAQAIQVHNAAGQLVYQSFEQLQGVHSLNTQNLSAGIYCVSVICDTKEKVLTQKLHVLK